MKKILSKIASANYKDLIFFSSISVMFFGILLQMEYAVDTYHVFANPAISNAAHFIGDGRFVTAFFTLVLSKLPLGNHSIYILSTLLALVSLTLSLYIFNSIIKDHIKKAWISRALSVLVILNVFVIELFMFIEKGILVTSILLNVIAVKLFVKYLKEKNKKNLLLAMLTLILASGCYQGTLALFIALSSLFIVKYSKSVKEFIINNILIISGYGIAGILNLTISKIFSGSRTSGLINIGESIKKVFDGSIEMFKTNGIINNAAVIIIGLLLMIFIVMEIAKTNKRKITCVLQLIYIVFTTYIIVIAPQFMQNTASIWMTPRSTYAFASIIGIVFTFAFIQLETNKKESIIMFGIVAIILITAQYISFSRIITERYKLNVLDKNKAEQIILDIKEYEKQNNVSIDTIVFNSTNIKYKYDGIVPIGDMNVTAFSTDWSTKAILEYYSNRRFNIISESITNYKTRIEYKGSRVYLNDL